jgi:NADP-dependent 3-hydroxy acid dehydrogenase YdfG
MNGAVILITGASAGIGAALAEHYAAPGVTLGLLARRTDRLEALAERLRARGAAVSVFTADVRDGERMAAVVREFDADAGGISLAIANAGISRGDRIERGLAAPTAEVIAVNVEGVINTLLPLMPLMIARRGGHLVAIGSVAGFRGLPGKGAYCASKAAVRMLMDSYRPLLRRHGIRVTTICPGWVETELSRNNPYPMPFLMDAPRAARLIARAIARGRRTYTFPWQMRIAAFVVQRLPERLLPTRGARS